ncbi:MAG: hypothetical protein K5985_05425 [Lachnospiraceae bacterium]|nr:hypothetical protein [Lachnospiraceae bacterium]
MCQTGTKQRETNSEGSGAIFTATTTTTRHSRQEPLNAAPGQMQNQAAAHAREDEMRSGERVADAAARWFFEDGDLRLVDDEQVQTNLSETLGGISKNRSLSTWEKTRRLKAQKKKEVLYSGETASAWRSRREAEQDGQGASAPEEMTVKEYKAAREALKAMVSCSTDFLDYSDDKTFVQNFEQNYSRLQSFAGLKKILESLPEETPETAGVYAGLSPAEIIAVRLSSDFTELGTDFNEANSLVYKYTRIRDFYRAKMDIISSPYYLVLKKEDTDGSGPEELERKAAELRAAGQTGLADYLSATVRLKRLEAQGVKKVAKKTAVFRREYDDGVAQASVSILGYSAETKNTGSSVSGKIAASAITASASYKDDFSEGSVSISVLKASLSGSLAAEAGMKNGKLVLDVGAQAEASVSALEAEAKVDSQFDPHAGEEVSDEERKRSLIQKGFFGIHGEAKGQALTAKGKATAKVGRITLPDDTEDTGAAFMLSGEAALLRGFLKGSLTIAGVKIGVTLSGSLGGVGGTVGAYITKGGKVGVSLGASLLAGAKVDLELDFSYWLDRLAESEGFATMKADLDRKFSNALDTLQQFMRIGGREAYENFSAIRAALRAQMGMPEPA